MELLPAAAITNAGKTLSICGVPYFTPIATLCRAKMLGDRQGRLNRPKMKSKTAEM
jgi:hypothetical protein